MICHRKFAKWICNGILLIAAFILFSVFMLNWLNQSLPAIKCEGTEITDPNILHKYNGDTVPTSYLIVIGTLTPLIEIFVVEILHSYSEYSYTSPMESHQWKRGASYAARWYRDYIYGLLFFMILTDICKTTQNSPRPHFVDSCKPNFTETDCRHGWVDTYTCTNKQISKWKLIDAHKSFPSAHATMGMFAAVFMIFYQHSRFSIKRHGAIAILWCHLAWLAWGVYCSLTRIVDYRHHPIDITIGGLIGVFGGIFTALYLSRNFRGNSKRDLYDKGNYIQQSKTRAMNGSATVIDGYISNSSLPQSQQMHQSITMPTEISNGSIQSTKTNPQGNGKIANTPQRPSLRRLLSSQSTLTQVSEMSEDRELDRL